MKDIPMRKQIARLRAQIRDLHGLNMREAVRAWKRLGGDCKPGRKNGETYFTHPAIPGIYKCGRKKSCPRELTHRIKQLLQQAA